MNEAIIWSFLKSQGMTDAGAAGLMGNLKPESNFNPKNLQNSYEKKLGYTDETYTAAVDSGTYKNFVRDGAGYGLCQWTYWTRKQALYAFCKAAGASIGDLNAQLRFLMKELTESFKGVLGVLMTTTSVREASDAVLLQFERPAKMNDPAVHQKRAEYGQKYYDQFAVVVTEKGDGKMNASEFIMKLQDIVDNYKTLYVMGCFGAPLTGGNVARYCQNHEYNRRAARTAMIKAAANQSPPVYGFDCVNLIKGVLWGWNGNASKTYGGAGYAINGVPDIGADTMITKCSGVSTDFTNIVPGEAVWLKGHIGVYIGNGKVIESSPAFKNCVQVTACSNIGAIHGMNGRKWTKHGKLPYITYDMMDNGGVANNQPVKEDDDMDVARFKELWGEMRKELQDNDSGEWSKEAREWAVSTGLIAGNGETINGEPNCMWADVLTREQLVTVLYRFAQMMGKV